MVYQMKGLQSMYVHNTYEWSTAPPFNLHDRPTALHLWSWVYGVKLPMRGKAPNNNKSVVVGSFGRKHIKQIEIRFRYRGHTASTTHCTRITALSSLVGSHSLPCPPLFVFFIDEMGKWNRVCRRDIWVLMTNKLPIPIVIQWGNGQSGNGRI